MNIYNFPLFKSIRWQFTCLTVLAFSCLNCPKVFAEFCGTNCYMVEGAPHSYLGDQYEYCDPQPSNYRIDNFNIYNTVWPKDPIKPNILKKVRYGGAVVGNCLSDDDLITHFNNWHQVYAYIFATILGEKIDKVSGSPIDRANRIIDIRGRAVAKIRTLAAELGQPADEGLLNSLNLNGDDNGIYDELKRLTELRSRKIQEEQDKIRETELTNLRAANEEARTNSERSAKAEKSYQESQKNLEVKLQEQIEKLENLQNQLKEQAKTEKILKQRQDRLYDALGDIFDQSEIQDPVMIEFFTKACELSPEFKSVFEDLKTAPAVRRLFKQRTQQLEKLFWSILKENKEMETLIDQPMQPAIGSTDSSLVNEAPALPTVSSQTESNKSNEL